MTPAPEDLICAKAFVIDRADSSDGGARSASASVDDNGGMRRFRSMGVLVALCIAAGACGSPTTHTPAASAGAAPVRPTALAAAGSGGLYIADPVRNQILERLADGRFVVVAGTGRAGFSGDGGPAAAASLDDPSGMAVGPDGSLYFADQANHRVRVVSADGLIRTGAGGGPSGASGFVTAGTPATRAAFDPSDVTFGPSGRLYIATGDQVLRMEADATLTPVVGAPGPYQGLHGVGGPAVEASADGANGIAFDSAGDLYLSGFNTKALLMVRPDGILTDPLGGRGFYPRGDGGLVPDGHGGVVAMDTQAVLALSPTGARTVLSFQDAAFHGIRGFSPNGIAAGRDGTVYVDTFYGNGYADRSAIAAIAGDGKSSHLLWEPSPGATAAPSPPSGQTGTGRAVIQVRLALDTTAVPAGTEISGVARVANDSGGPVPTAGCSPGPWVLLVGLTDDHITYEPALGFTGCAHPAEIPAGTSRMTFRILTTYQSCQQPGGESVTPVPACIGGNRLPPLPTGRYRTTVVIPGVDAGLYYAAPLDVTLS